MRAEVFRTAMLAQRLRAALAGLAAVLLLSALAIFLVLRQAERAQSDQSQRIFPARVAASQLLTALVDQETGLRGYAIKREDRFLEPYKSGLIHEAALRTRLESEIGPHDRARSNLLTVYASITAWRQDYAQLALLDVREGGALTTIDYGKQLFDQVRASNAQLDATLAAELRSAQREADQDRQLVLVVLGATALVVVVGLVGLQRALRVLVLTPLRDLGQQVQVVSRGTHDLPIKAGGPPDIRDMGQDVESMRLELVSALSTVEAAQRDLELRAAELARSNADLEQFAYVASHDLQEPLRKVASFCQLLEKRYSGQLDERGEQYIAFAVDGAKRMQRLITDLLTFSRVGRTSSSFVSVNVEETVRAAWSAIDAQVRETDAHLDVDAQGEVCGDPALLQMLFTNLLGNACKYRQPGLAPRVSVTAVPESGMVRIDVADNGIGIPPEYEEKVFVIFQRLHGRDEYEGTGIGLALCKKVVEFHGGTIELRPSPLGGACLSFTLPSEGNTADE